MSTAAAAVCAPNMAARHQAWDNNSSNTADLELAMTDASLAEDDPAFDDYPEDADPAEHLWAGQKQQQYSPYHSEPVLDVDWHELTDLAHLNSGSMCTIFSCVWRGSPDVVAKLVRTDCADPEVAASDLELELQVLALNMLFLHELPYHSIQGEHRGQGGHRVVTQLRIQARHCAVSLLATAYKPC